MGKALIAYCSRTGMTEEMAEYVAKGAVNTDEGLLACQAYGKALERALNC